MSKTEHENFDPVVLAGASSQQIDRLLDEGQRYVVAWITTHQMDEETRRRYRAIDRALHNVPGDILIDAILRRAHRCTYHEAGWHVEILDGQIRDSQETGDEREYWRPRPNDVEALIQALQAKRDPREVPHCNLEAHLASFASKVDAKRYLPFLLECAKRHIAAWVTFQAVLQRWLASPNHRNRPSNPPYGQYVTQALQRCEFDALEGLFELAKEPGAEALIPETLVNIVVGPWFQNRLKRFPFGDSFIEDHYRRRDARRILQEPTDVLQSAADRVARLLLEKLEPALVAGASLEPSTTAARPNFFPLSGVAALLARVPSSIGTAALVEVLKRTDIRGFTYQSIAQGLIRQGAMLPAEVLLGLKETLLREAMPAWVDDSTRYLLTGLAVLHFFVEPADQGLRQLNEMLPDLLKKADFWQFARELESIPKEEALDVLLKLLAPTQHHDNLAERVVVWLRGNMDRVRPQTLLRLVVDGTLFKLGKQQYLLEHEIAPQLARAISVMPELVDPLLNYLEGRTDPSDEPSVCAILSNMKDPRARLLLRRFLDETTTARGGETASRMLLNKFVREEHPDSVSGWYEIYPHAWNEFREWLFQMASTAGPSKNRSRALLIRLEENRQETGRPADEPRHPKIDSGVPWPSGLYV